MGQSRSEPEGLTAGFIDPQSHQENLCVVARCDESLKMGVKAKQGTEVMHGVIHEDENKTGV